jgi:hypothetical protein
VPEIELGIREQRERELPRDLLRVGAVEDQLGDLLPCLLRLALLGQLGHVAGGVGEGAQRAAVAGGAAALALALATRIDEVKTIRDKAAAVIEYARRAKDKELISHATDIKARAQIRGGELLIKMVEQGERRGKQDGKSKVSHRAIPTLSDLGVTLSDSSRWQRLAKLSREEQIERIERAKRRAILTVDGAGKGRKVRPLVGLIDLGVTKSDSSRWQRLAQLSREEQERDAHRDRPRRRAAEQRYDFASFPSTEMHPIPHGPGAHRRISEAGPAR